MPFDLAQMLKIEEDNLRAGVIETFLMRSNVMRTMPFEDAGALNLSVTLEKTLPGTGFRKINAAYAEGTGTFEQMTETVYPLGHDIDVDKVFVRDPAAIVDPRARQVSMTLRSMAYTFNDYFINGDQASDPDGFTGIKKRISNLAAAQSIVAATNGLDVKASTANQNQFLDQLDELFYSIEDGAPDVLYMNATTLLGISSVLRRLGLLDTTRDMFGREIAMYKGAQLVDIGVKADQTTKIITNTETTGSSNVTTSIYAVRYGVGLYLHGIQLYDLDVEDLGQLEAKPVFRTRVDWPIGLANWHPRAMARYSGLIWT